MKLLLVFLIISGITYGMANNNLSCSPPAHDMIEPDQLAQIKRVITEKLKEVNSSSIKIARTTIYKTDCFDDAVKEEFEQTISKLTTDENKKLMTKFVAADDEIKRKFFDALKHESNQEAIRKFFKQCEEHDWILICHIFELSGYPLVKPLSSRTTKRNEQDRAFTHNVEMLNWRRQRFVKQFGVMPPEVQKCVVALGVIRNTHGNQRPDLEILFDNEKKPLEEIFKYLGYEVSIS